MKKGQYPKGPSTKMQKFSVESKNSSESSANNSSENMDSEEEELADLYALRKKTKLVSKDYEEFAITNKLKEWKKERINDEKTFLYDIAPIFFNILKKNCKWNEKFINKFKKILNKERPSVWSNINPKICLYSFLNSADEELRIKILRNYSKIAPVPLIMPIWEDNFTQFRSIINKDLMWILEEYYLVVSFSPESESIGKSYYLNYLLKTNFYENDMPNKFNKTIEIYLDAFKGTSKKVAFIDINYNADEIVTGRLIEVAQVLLIHTTAKIYKKNKEYEEQYYRKYNKPIVFLIRDDRKSCLGKNANLFELRSRDKPILLQKLPLASNIKIKDLDFITHTENVIQFIFKELDQYKIIRFTSMSYLNNILRLDDKRVKAYTRIFNRLKVNLNSHREILNTSEYLSIVPIHQKWCEITERVYNNDKIKVNRRNTDQLKAEANSLAKDMKNLNLIKPKSIVQLFIQVAKYIEFAPYFLLGLADYIKIITDEELKNENRLYDKLKEIELEIKFKGKSEYLTYFSTDIFKDLNMIWQETMTLLSTTDKILITDKQEVILLKLSTQLNNLNESKIKKSFSIELLWRELIYFYNYQPNNRILWDNFDIIRFFNKSINCGYPFEIIDGDNLYMCDNFLEVALGMKNERILVISIIGPQSSGKSTLLNYLFGCTFQTSAGRCTRGIYGTYIGLKDTREFDGILVLDTEGLLSIHHYNTNADFDRKITLFILAVSQIVIINVKGEMQGPLLELLKICIQSLHEIKANKVFSPEVFIVLNQYTDLNTENIDKDINHVKEVMGNLLQEREVGLNDLITLNKQHVQGLPNAFLTNDQKIKTATHTTERINHTNPNYVFVKKTKKLAANLLKIACQKHRENKVKPEYDNMSSWVRIAKMTWDLISNFPSFVYFTNVKQAQEDKIMQLWINEQTFKRFEVKKQNEFIVHEFQSKISKFTTTTELTISINEYFKPKFDMLLNDFKQNFKINKFSPEGITEKLDVLKIRLKQISGQWDAQLQTKYLKNSFENSRKFGASKLNKAKIDLLKNVDITKEEAMQHFLEIWDKIMTEMKNEINRERRSIELLKGQMNSYTTIFRHFRKAYTAVNLYNLYQEKDYETINICHLNNNEKMSNPFVTNNKPPRSPEDKIRKDYFDLNHIISKKRKVIYIEKEAFIKCIDRDRIRHYLRDCISKSNFIPRYAQEYIYNKFTEEMRNLYHLAFAPRFRYFLFENKDEPRISDFTQSFMANLSIQDISILQRICKSYHPSTKFKYLELSENSYINAKRFRAKIKQVEYDIHPSFAENNIILQLSTVINFCNPDEYNNWLQDLVTKKELPLVDERVHFAKKHFNWGKLMETVTQTIKRKLYLDPQQLILRDATQLGFITEMANEINKIIENVNESLSQLSLQLNQEVIDNLHLCGLLSIWKTNEVREWNELNKPIIEMERSKQDHLSAFINEFENDVPQTTKNTSQKIFDQIKSKIESSITERIIETFNLCIDIEKQSLARGAIQDDVDKEYIFDNVSNAGKGLKYINHFEKLLEENFQRKWDCIDQKMKELNKKIQGEILTFYNELYDNIQFLQGEIRICRLDTISSMVFAAKEGGEGVMAEKYKVEITQVAMAFFYGNISGKKTTSWIIDNIEFSFKPTVYKIPVPQQGLKAEHLVYCSEEYFREERTYNIDLLCDGFLELIEKERKHASMNINYLNMSQITRHTKSKLEEMKIKAIGCTARCHMCLKYCDADHGNKVAGSKDSPHACNKGHQIRALAGNKIHDNEASVFCCEEMEENDQVSYEDNMMTWNEFTSKVENCEEKCWHFKELLLQRLKRTVDTSRFQRFWKLVGKEFCKLHTRLGNEMIYCDHPNKDKLKGSKSSTNIHAILALDSSASMRGDRWDALIRGVEKFLEFTQNRGTVSIIRFQSTSTIVFENEIISPSLAQQIVYSSGATYFTNPFNDAADLLQKYQYSNSNFHFIFMSDGEAEYPKKEIYKIQTLNIDFKFYAISYGNNQTLEDMADALNGKCLNVVDENMLEETFGEIGYEIIRPDF